MSIFSVRAGWAVALAFACALVACEPGQTESDAGEDGDAPSNGPRRGGCDATPGNYQVNYAAVGDDCGGVDDLPFIDRFTISPEGEILSAGGQRPGAGSAPSGCFDDDASIDACLVSFSRECTLDTELGTAVVLGDYTLDFDRRTGSVAIEIGVLDGSTLLQSCQASQRASISSR